MATNEKAPQAARINPFRPGSIVGPGMFAGRAAELRSLARNLQQTKSGTATSFLVQGERGIGKSSLLFYLQELAGRRVVTESGQAFNFLTVSIGLEPTETQESLIAKLGAELKGVATENKRVKQLLANAWEFLKKWEIAGVKYNGLNNSNHPADLLRDLISTLVETERELGDEFDGLLFLIDEADKAPATAHLGATLKHVTEQLTKRGAEKIAFGLFGLPEVVNRLKESHESSPRLFEFLTLDPLLPSEAEWAVRRGLESARERTGVLTSIEPAALRLIADLSEGYPHFIQQFAYSAFDVDSDFNIDTGDVTTGSFQENGAFQQLGVKYFQGMYFDQIRSDDYRAVLCAMCKRGDGWISKAEIREETKLKETTLTNAVNALRTRHIIIPKDGVAGVYRLPSRAFAVWIGAYNGVIPEQAKPHSASDFRPSR